MGLSGALVKALRKPKGGEEIISDWKWRPMEEVRKDIGNPTEVPSYITDNYGQFMREQAERAKKGDLGPRDMLKAYGITMSSIGRTSRKMNDDIASGSIRPEGYMAEWLLSPEGQKYLNAAQRGDVDANAIEDAARRFTPFGKANTLRNELTWAAGNLGREVPDIQGSILGPTDMWRQTAQNLPGIGPAKSGFIASLLGRGDMPTFDARQIKLQTGQPSEEASKYMRRQKGAGGDAAVDRLAARQSDLNLQMPPEFEPHRQHLSHHALWDIMGGQQTTHDDLVRAMQRGAIKPELLGATAAGGGAALATVQALRDRQAAP